MVDGQPQQPSPTQPSPTQPSPTQPSPTRSAAGWATAVAVPVALIVGLLTYFQVFAGARNEVAAGPTQAVAAGPMHSAAATVVPTTPVSMSAAALSPQGTQVCPAVIAHLPATVRDLPARRVSAGPLQNAAYGEPPLTVACGVAAPAMCPTAAARPDCVPLTADVLLMNGVCWYGTPGPAANVFTTMDRTVAVRVTVPASLSAPAQWANEFSDAVAKADPSTTSGVPTGCRTGA